MDNKIVTLKTESGPNLYINLGWDWYTLLFAGFFGMPLFKKGLTEIAFIFLMLAVTHFFLWAWAIHDHQWRFTIFLYISYFFIISISILISRISGMLTISKKLCLGYCFNSQEDNETYNKEFQHIKFNSVYEYLVKMDLKRSVIICSAISLMAGIYFFFIASMYMDFTNMHIKEIFGSDMGNYQVAGYISIAKTITASLASSTFIILSVILFLKSLHINE